MIIQLEFLLERQIQCLGVALMNVDQHLQLRTPVCLQKCSPKLTQKTLPLDVTKMMRETGDGALGRHP